MITGEQFETAVLQSRVPTLVAFLAGWCEQSKTMAATLAGANLGAAAIVTVDIDDCPEIPQRYGVCAVPTLILFSDGRPLDVKIGAASKTRIAEWISASLGDAT